MVELNIGDVFKTSCSGYAKSYYKVIDKTTIKPNKTLMHCDFYYQIIKLKGKNKQWMGHGCEIQEKITELKKETVVNNYEIY